jgi:hypothetical protein
MARVSMLKAENELPDLRRHGVQKLRDVCRE